MYYVYILENDRSWHYIGSCANLEKRLKRHNQNSVRSTKNKGPFRIIYRKEFETRTQARIKENEIKRHKNIEYFLKLVNERLTPSSSLV